MVVYYDVYMLVFIAFHRFLEYCDFGLISPCSLLVCFILYTVQIIKITVKDLKNTF